MKKTTTAARQIRFALATNGNHKQRGGYYTPLLIADFLAEWAVTPTVRTILEPSAGDGAIVEAVKRRSSSAKITALELYADQAEIVRSRGLSKTNVITGDFFHWFRAEKVDGAFDAAVGNPPFIRFHDFEEDHRTPAFVLMTEEGLRPSRLTNAWVPFIVAATKALRRGGRLAFVVPAELLQVSYAAELREYLTRKFSQLTLVTFRRLVFDGIQQETVLLLGVRGEGRPAKMRFVEADDLADLSLSRIRRARPVSASLRHARDKWTRYYLTPGELGLIEALEQCESISRLGDLAEVDVGIVTGRNEFFVLTKDAAKTLGLDRFCLPLVGRSAHIPGVVLRPDDWSQLSEEGASCLLLQLGNVDRKALSEKAMQYVEYGEASGFHERYKCRIRQPRWWAVPSPWVPDAFLLRQIHDGPRIISNNAAATCTDTIHRIRMRNGHSPAWLAAASVNSLTWSFAEILGRSYGGGVLELEPTEAELLPIPVTSELDIDHVDGLARNESMDDVLGYVDERALIPMGLSRKDIQSLRSIWRKLFDRRRARKGRSRVGLETLVALPISALDLLRK